MSATLFSTDQGKVALVGLALLAGGGAGLLCAALVLTPPLQRAEDLLAQAIKSTHASTTSTTPIEIIPVQPSVDAPRNLPTSLGVGRATPTLPLFRMDARTSQEDLRSTQAVGTAVALTSDGWLVLSEQGLPSGARLADLLIGWKNQLLTPTKGYRDHATGLVYLKVAAQDLPAAALLSRLDTTIGEAVWMERAPNVYHPTQVTRLGYVNTSTAALSSDQWNRVFAIDDVNARASGAVWDARGQLVGMAQPTSNGAMVMPADAIRAGLAGLLAGGEIRRPSLGVHYLDLSDVFSRQGNAAPLIGARVQGEKHGAPAVTPNGPSAGVLREGDVIERMDQDVLDGSWTLAERVLEYRPGTTVTVAGLRQGRAFTAQVTFGSVVTSEGLK